MARYKKYRYGGKRVPGMYKAQDGNGEDAGNMMGINADNQSRPPSPMGPQIQSMDERPTIQASGEGQVMETTQNPNMQVQQQNQRQQMMGQPSYQDLLYQINSQINGDNQVNL